MEVDLPNGGAGDASSSPYPVQIKKARLSAGGDSQMCNGDSEPMNGQNGNHAKDEEPMDVDEDSNSNSQGANSNGQGEPHVERRDGDDDRESEDQKSAADSAKDIEEEKGEEEDERKGEDENDAGENSKGRRQDEEDDSNSQDSVKSEPPKDSSGENSITKDGESRSLDEGSKPATPSTVGSEESKPASPSDKSKAPSTDREVDDEEDDEETPLTEEDMLRTKDVDQRELKIKRIEDSVKDKDDLRPVAKLLFGIGVDLAAQHIYKDLVRAQKKKDTQKMLNRKGREQLQKLRNTYQSLNDRNSSYVLKMKSCDKCGFKTESANVIEWHLEFAHGQDSGRYECSFCDFETRLPAPFFFHMEAEHSRKGRVFMKKAFFSCPQCPYENNSKHAVTKHRLKCDRQFSLKRNQEPLPTDCDIPLKKPKSLMIKQARNFNKQLQGGNNQSKNANIAIRPAISSASSLRVNPSATVQSILNSRGHAMNQSLMSQRARVVGQPARPQNQVQGPGGQMFTLVNPPVMLQQNFQSLLTGVRQPMPQQSQPIQYVPPAQNISQIAQQVVAQVTQQHSAAQQQKAIQEILKRAQGPVNQGSSAQRSQPNAMTILDAQVQAAAAGNPKFEICEICGGFVKDRESLRIHFYWAHKVDIQKDVFARLNPHLKCDSCPQAFWTYQGLARHRQISHVKPRERTYRCYLCGAKNIENIITHLSMAHNVKLNTMYKTGKCLVCGLGFAGEKGLKRHIHTAHAELLKGQPDIVETASAPPLGLKPAAMPPSSSSSSSSKSKQGGGNPVPTGLFENASKKKKFEPVCSLCNIVFPSVESFTFHCNKLHVFKCWRCHEKWASKDLLQKHWFDKHRRDTEECLLCKEQVIIGRPFIRHMKRSHLKQCSVMLNRMKKKDVDHYMELDKQRRKFHSAPNAKSDVIVLSDEEEEEEEVEEGEEVVEDVTKNDKPEASETGNENQKPVLEAGDQEVMEVDGEKIVVEVSQDEDDPDSEAGKKDEEEEEMEEEGGEEGQDKS